MKKLLPLLLLSACVNAPVLDTSTIYATPPQLDGVLLSEPLGANQYTIEDCEKPIYQSEQGDVWLTPKQFTERGYGDCEDYAICYFYAFKAKRDDVYILSTNNHSATLVGDKVYDMGRVFDYAEWKAAKQPIVMYNEKTSFAFKEAL